jgi:predicted Zn-dependent protease with MMP-like domain
MARLDVSPSEFESLVAKALDELPPEFADLLENIAVVIADEPDEDDFDLSDTPHEHELLGIFRGVARTDLSWTQLPSLPNQIVIFRRPILRIARSRAEVVAEVQETVIHELGHFFGLSDEEMPY